MKFRSLTSSMRLRSAKTALAAGALLLFAATAALSQENQAPKPPAYTVLYTFTGGADGSNPIGTDPGLFRDKEGNLFGTTTFGGTSQIGVAFKLDRAGNQTVLHTFTGSPDGVNPTANLIRDEKGNFYGTTTFGGGASGSAGTVFRVDQAGNEAVLYSFTGGADGANPTAGVIRDEQGNLYGTTTFGGSATLSAGTVFKLDRFGNETVLYSFTGGADGGNPAARLIRDKKGNLYGTTLFGGASFVGVVFKLDPAGKQTVLHTFTRGADGGQPFAGLVRDEDGILYGAASAGGAAGNGVVFRLGPAGKFKVLYSFTGGTDGGTPYGRLLQCGGHLYGTTVFGGDLGGVCGGFCGVVFKLDRAGKETVLYSFHGGADGANPYVGLTPDAKGNLYGTTGSGGDLNSPQPSCAGLGCGVVFKLKSDNDCAGSAEEND